MTKHARLHQFSVKYKPYGDPSDDRLSPDIFKKKPSEHIRDLLNPPLLHRDGVSRPKPCIIEKQDFTLQPYQFLSSVPEDEPLFQPFPPEINFSDYEPCEKYTALLKLRNNDKASRQVKVVTTDPEILMVYQRYDQGSMDIGTSKVACGMEVTFIVTFCPECDEDYQSDLIVVTDREKFIVPVRCFGKKPILSIPDEIIFPPTPVKCCSKKNLTIQNIGTKSGLFSITTSGAFDIKPTSGRIEKGCFFQCELTFQPNQAERYEEELKILYTEYSGCMISKVIGSGCELDIGLSTSLSVAPVTFIGKSSSMNIQLINESSCIVQFMWPEFVSNYQNIGSYKDMKGSVIGTADASERLDNNALFREVKSSNMMMEALSITPAEGELWPGTIMDITITFSPRKALRYIHMTHCVISGKSDPLMLELQGLGIGPQVQLVPDFHEMGNVNLYSTYIITVLLQNTGELEAVYRLMGQKNSRVVRVTIEPDSGALSPMETQTISVEVVCIGMGEFDESFLWEVDGVLHNLSFRLRGHVGAPGFNLETKEFDFGNVSYGVECIKQLRLQNTSPVDLSFCFQIEKCEDSLCDYKVIPEASLLHPDETQVLNLSIIPWEETKFFAKLLVDLQDVGNSVAFVSLKSECFSPKVHLSPESLIYGECLLRYNYTQVVELVNSTNVPAVYEILPLEDEYIAVANILTEAPNSVIPAFSKQPLKITIATRVLGQISLSLRINISGRDSNPLVLAISAHSIGPTLQLEQINLDIEKSKINLDVENSKINLDVGNSKINLDVENCKINLDIENSKINLDVKDIIVNYGNVHVLENNYRTILVRNLACIPAEVNISLCKKHTVFTVEDDVFTLEPFGSQEIKVTANLDDCVKFTDTLKISTEGAQYLVRLKAVGIGSTIVCSELVSGTVDFGKQVTLRSFSHTFTAENLGRKQLSMAWDNKSEGTKNPPLLEQNKKMPPLSEQKITKNSQMLDQKVMKNSQMSKNLPTLEHKSIFSVVPEKAIIKPHSSCMFTITGLATNPGSVVEQFRCNVTTAKAVISNMLSVTANISPLQLWLSDTEFTFTQNNSPLGNSQELNRILSCKNVAELPLHFDLITKPPFLVSHNKCVLQPSECMDVTVGVEKQNFEDKKSKVIHGVLDIIYTGTSEREALKLHANVCYPNLEFDALKLNFGCVLEGTLKQLCLTVKNNGSLPSYYHWFFLEDVEGVLINSDASRNSQEKAFLNQIFDILPVRGCLKPGEEESIEFSCFAFPGYLCHRATAICEVEGGPTYTIELIAETGVISYSLSDTSLDFGLQQFNKVVEKTFTLVNTGKIPFPFSISFIHPTSSPLLKILPLQGNLAPTQKQLFQVWVCPALPEKYKVDIKIQISHVSPQQMHILGEGHFPHISVDLPRVRNNKFLLMANQALENLSKIELQDGSESFAPDKVELQEGSQFLGDDKVEPQDESASVTAGKADIDFSVMKGSSTDIMEPCRELPLEQVDVEIDRVLLVQGLVEANLENNAALWSTEEASEKKTDIEKFVLNKYLCDFGNVILGESVQKLIHIKNDSVLPVSFKGEKSFLKGTGYFFEPEQQIRLSSGLSSSRRIEFKLMLKTDNPKFKPGEIEASIPLHIKEAPRTIVLLKANVMKPLLAISMESLDFESVQLGHCKIMYVQLHNPGKVPCTWEIMKPEPGISDVSSIRDSSAFRFFPRLGVVMPNDYFNVEVRFMPLHKQRTYSAKFPIKILHEPSLQFISCKGHSYNLPFHITPTELQLPPIIPNGYSPVERSLKLVNSSDESIEVYSLDFDIQYITEESILRDHKNYNEEGFLFVEPRKAGQPFWKDLMPTPENIAGENLARPQSPREPLKPAKEKALPSKKGVSVKLPKDEPQQTPVVETPMFDLSASVFILHGPPFCGKTTQANFLRDKFNFPVIDIKEVVQNLESVLGDSEGDRNIQEYVSLVGEINSPEKELIKIIMEELKKLNCKDGVIFDGLLSKTFDPICIAKCILYAIGMKPTTTSVQGNDSENDVKKPKVLWVGNPSVYVSIFEFDQAGLGSRYAKIPEIYHAKKCVESVLVKTLPNCYPFSSRFPTEEELRRFFFFEPFLYDLFGECKENESDNLQKRIKVLRINGLQDRNIILQEQLKTLHMPGASSQSPLPQIFQVLRKPTGRTSSLQQVTSNFSILTQDRKVENYEAINNEKNVTKRGESPEKRLPKGKLSADQVSEAGTAFDDKMSVSSKSVATRKAKSKKDNFGAQSIGEASPLGVIPEGFSIQSRWIIPPHSSTDVRLRFWAASEQNFDHTFLFQAVGAPGRVSLHCKATCARPQFTCYLKKPCIAVMKKTPVQLQNQKFKKEKVSLAQMQSQKFRKEKVLDFHAIPAGVNPEGFPGIQDSEHSMRLVIHNTGLFDLHADFDVVIPQSPKSNKPPAFFIHPTFMDLKVDERQDLRIYAYPKQDQLGSLEAKLTCRVMNNPEQIEYILRCFSDKPQISLEPSTLNFERLLIGLYESREIVIRNTCALPVQWKLIGFEKVAKELTFSDTFGTIDAKQTGVIKATFYSMEEKCFKEKFGFQVFYIKGQEKPAQELTLNISAEAVKVNPSDEKQDREKEVKQEAAACGSGNVDFGTVKIPEDSLKFLVLQNKGKCAVSFDLFLKNVSSKIFSAAPTEGAAPEMKKEQKVSKNQASDNQKVNSKKDPKNK